MRICVALASNDPWEPIEMAGREQIEMLKIMGKEFEPIYDMVQSYLNTRANTKHEGKREIILGSSIAEEREARMTKSVTQILLPLPS
jgi:hypothetical protein